MWLNLWYDFWNWAAGPSPAVAIVEVEGESYVSPIEDRTLAVAAELRGESSVLAELEETAHV